MPIDARARASGNPADHTTFSCRVAALEDNDDPRPGGLGPNLQTGKLDLELCELFLEFLAPHLAGFGHVVMHLFLVSYRSHKPLFAMDYANLITSETPYIAAGYHIVFGQFQVLT